MGSVSKLMPSRLVKSCSPAGPIAVLPQGYRLQARRMFVVQAGESPQTSARVDVNSVGTIVWIVGATGEKDYTSLDSISFEAGAPTASGTD